MCGLTGLFRPGASLTASCRDDLARMTSRLAHRGPDTSGQWDDPEAGIALGHRRLSILELSSTGNQPMVSASARHVVTVNGEIYNHLDLRQELARDGARTPWRGHSDIETLVEAIDRWGVEPTLRKASGMFALAVWDRRERVLTLARDRVGEKPLYFGWQGRVLLFGSELKALRAHPAFAARVDRDRLAIYLRRGYVPGPHSIYQEISKLPPGRLITFGWQRPAGEMPPIRDYWSFRDAALRGLAGRFTGSDGDATDLLEFELGRAVASQCVADVPLGAFLSGGIDSSTVVALMQAGSSRPVRTFAIGFKEEEFNESPHARAVAAHLGTDHTELIVTPREAMDVVPRLPALYDEPFGDSSAIPTFLVAQLARGHVTVALSGDGGDELFGGYTRYWRAERLWRVLRRVPRALRASLATALGSRYSRHVAAASPRELYDSVMLDETATGLVPDATDPAAATIGLDDDLAARCFYEAMMLADSTTYLPDDILVKVDRASMGVSLESRVPMLDPRVIELAWRLPSRMKWRNGEGKWLLRQVLRKYVPASLHDRPKKGFGMPVGQWIRGEMREWAEAELAPDRLRREGYLDRRRVRQRWSEYLAGRTRSGESIWRILMFQAWLEATSRE